MGECKIKKDSESETDEGKYDEVTDKNLIMMLINENKEFINKKTTKSSSQQFI